MAKKMKKRVTKVEKLLMAVIVSMIMITPVAVISITSLYFSYTREITNIEDDLIDVRQETKELEVKRQEKLNYNEVQGYASRSGSSQKQENIKKVV